MLPLRYCTHFVVKKLQKFFDFFFVFKKEQEFFFFVFFDEEMCVNLSLKTEWLFCNKKNTNKSELKLKQNNMMRYQLKVNSIIFDIQRRYRKKKFKNKMMG